MGRLTSDRRVETRADAAKLRAVPAPDMLVVRLPRHEAQALVESEQARLAPLARAGHASIAINHGAMVVYLDEGRFLVQFVGVDDLGPVAVTENGVLHLAGGSVGFRVGDGGHGG